MLRVAGEIADRLGEKKVNENHVSMAQEKIDMDRITETVKAQPLHSQVILHVVINLHEKMKSMNGWKDKRIVTCDVFEKYREFCSLLSLTPLTQRRVGDLINEMDMAGILSSKVISKGRYGRTREIYLSLQDNIMVSLKGLLHEKFGM